MGDTANEMKLCEAVLALIERARSETGNPTLGDFIERVVIEHQFQELESDILENPGAFEPWLIRLRRPD
jgi:hypothetical protein